MQSLSELLRAEPFHEDAVHARLETWGFNENSESKKPLRRAFSRQRSTGTRRARWEYSRPRARSPNGARREID
jgi:hypothetical protein